jgi:hypothetical protein
MGKDERPGIVALQKIEEFPRCNVCDPGLQQYGLLHDGLVQRIGHGPAARRFGHAVIVRLRPGYQAKARITGNDKLQRLRDVLPINDVGFNLVPQSGGLEEGTSRPAIGSGRRIRKREPPLAEAVELLPTNQDRLTIIPADLQRR